MVPTNCSFTGGPTADLSLRRSVFGEPNIPGSVSRFFPEVLEAVDRVQLQLAQIDALQALERNVDAGRAQPPQLAVELLVALHGFAADSHHDVAPPDAGLVGRPLRRNP